MSNKVIFKIDKDLDFKNHLIGMRVILSNPKNAPTETIEYFEKLKNSTEIEQKQIFEEKTAEFYKAKNTDRRASMQKETQEMWDKIEKQYFKKAEEIYQRKFPFKGITGILSTTPMCYGYDFNKEKPWFACTFDSPVKSIHIAMHEIFHTYFHKYFMEEYKIKFNLTDQQIWMIKEALTVLLNVEFKEIRSIDDKGKPGHEALREKINETWLKTKNFKKVLENACIYIKK